MKSKHLTKSQARAFVRRWRMVNAAEAEELRGASVGDKIAQLATLMASVRGMGWDDVLREEEDEVRGRWMALRRAFGVG